MNSMPILRQLSDNSVTSSCLPNNLSSLHFNQSLSNSTTNKLLNQLIWWRKSRRAKSVLKSNVCVIMKSEQSTRIFNQSHHNSITESFHLQTSVTPAVSFINTGEGLVSMQLMDRVMINDNQLYSMGLSEHQINYNQLSDIQTMPNQSDSSTTLHTKNDSLFEYNVENKKWFYGSIERENAIKTLDNCPIGSFIVRYSMTKQNCFALTLRVPNDYHMTGIAHYLILMTERQTFKIKGFNKEFESLESLLIHHSIMKELLPCPLLLPNNPFVNNFQNRNHCNYSSNNELNNRNTESEDILIDIDSDPNYQKLLINFRKSMSQLS